MVIKKKTTSYKEADPIKQAVFIEVIKDVAKDMLVYIDESGINTYLHRSHGYAKKGQKIYGKISGIKYSRENFIGAYVNGGLITAACYKDSCNKILFETWVEFFLIPVLKPNQIVIMDNASFHKSEKVKKMIENAKCKLLFLPPYSPELNPIEKFWANLKRLIRKILPNFENLANAVDSALNSYLIID